MKKIKRIMVVFAVCFVIFLPLFSASAASAADTLPAASDNLGMGLRSKSELVATDNGYMRVYYDGEKIGIEYYDDNFEIQSKRFLDMELSIWGGFYAGSDAYYLVEGQVNTEESDTAEVIRVIRYDTSWEKTGTANITGNAGLFGGEVREPFDYGCVEMTEHDGTLYIVTGHEGYVDPEYNQGHQGFLMIAVDEASMTGEIVDCDLWHSFAQYIECRDSDLYVLEQSEGSRYTKLTKYDTGTLKESSFPVLQYGGSHTSAWAISCYASVDGMAVSSDNVLCLGTSIDQSQYDNVSSDTAHNIYLTVTPISDFSEGATTVKWLTNYTGDGKSFLGTKITRINDNRFMVSWEEFGTSQEAGIEDGLSTSILHYVFLDGAGNVVSDEFTAPAPISDCQPVVKGSKIVYYGSNANMVDFYSIDAQTGEFHKRVYRVAGENAAWNLADGVLTISGTGPITVDTEAHYRYPVSSTAGGFVHSSSDNAWKPVREKVNKIVIEEGITDIPESAFAYFTNLVEVEIKPGVNSIGEKAFYSCNSLSKITIPSSVTSIGEDFLWTGSYWISDESHVVRAKIYAPEGSYAASYAKENGISYGSSEPDDGKDDGSGGSQDDGKDDGSGGSQDDGKDDGSGGSQGDGKDDGSGGSKDDGKDDGSGGSKDDGKDDTTGEDITNDKGDVSILNATVLGLKKSYAYNGKAKMPGVTVKLGGKVLKKGADYIISYVNNRNTGKAAVKIQGIGNYSGVLVRTFKIVPKKAAKVKLKSPKSKTIKITWKKDAQADGYQIQYARNAKFTKNKKQVLIAKKTKGSRKIKRLAKGRKYFVRIRAYKKIDGKKCYGAWSKAARVKCK